MKLSQVSFGNQAGSNTVCRVYCSGFTVGQSYQVLGHGMDGGLGSHYFQLQNDMGTKVWVPANCFSFR